LVYQAIERSGNKGIWTRDIKVNTNISQNTLTKTLKILEQRNLIKSIRSVVSKSKKLYMVFDMVPAKEITGGPWYSDQEFDHDFVNALGEIIVNIVQKGNIVGLQDIAHKVRISGVSKVDLSLEELELVVNTLIYDYRLEEVSNSTVGSLQGIPKRYKVTTSPAEENSVTNSYLSGIPCGACPVLALCSDHSVISPRTCEYYKQWLKDAVDMQTEEENNQSAIDNTNAEGGKYDW
jgi:DNA-directed RNA polymerase III subunit RPC6